MKKKAPEQQLCDASKRIRQEINHWHYINKIGCQDPFWPDGCNMNLVRNHIISYKLEIQQICEGSGFALPEEKLTAIQDVISLDSHNSISKVDAIEALRWLVEEYI